MNTGYKREISCRVIRMLLMYVREKNNGSIGNLLEGLELDEPYLMDVNNWVSHAFLQVIYKRMVDLLDDPLAPYKMAITSGRFQSLGFLDRLVLLLGDPKIIYGKAPKYNRLIKQNGDVFIHEMGPTWVVIEDRYHDGSIKTRYDCDYTRGVLSGIPTMFGLPVAHIEELRCQVEPANYGHRVWTDSPVQGAQGCLYRIEFDTAAKPPLRQRLFRRPRLYRKAIEDLLEANRTIQERYNQVIQLAADLDSVNQQLLETKRQLESSKKELETSEEKYRILAENASDIIWTLNLESKTFDYLSPSVRKVMGMSDDDPIEIDLQRLLSPQNYQSMMALLKKELALEKQGNADPNRYRTTETQMQRKDGSYVWTESRLTFIRNEDRQPVGVLGVTRDISERKTAQAALSAEKERLAVTLRSIGDGVITTDRGGAVTLINSVAEKLTGWEEVDALGQSLAHVFNIVDPQSRQPAPPPVEGIMNNKKTDTLNIDSLLIHRTGSEILIEHSGAPLLDNDDQVFGALLVFKDVTAQRKLEGELQKVEKLESLGVLAGGIAHDFNNFLSGIAGNLSLAKLHIPQNSSAHVRLDAMERATLQAKNLTQQLLTFSKGGDPIKTNTELTHLVNDAADFAARGSKVRCEFNFSDGPLHSDVDEGQIVQVIHNLVLNAVQAMPEGGTIHITAIPIDLPLGNEVSLKPGKYIKLCIQDQGIGIAKKHLKNIFDPYFTTKNRGSGLGLAVAYAVIDKHGGRITVDSQIGAGTTFTMYLPATSPVNRVMRKAPRPLITGSGRVLVMDDEYIIRDVLEQMLKALGYEVSLAANGEEAIELYKEAASNGQRFDAVILDLTVPGAMGGKDAINELLKIDKGVKAIVSSGYSNDPIMANFQSYGFCYAVQKPYNVHDISNYLQKLFKEDK